MTGLAAVVGRLAAETDPAVPGLREGLTEYDISPGLLGFLVIFAAVLACIPLLRSMVGKIRGVQYRELPQDGPAAEPGTPTPGGEPGPRDGSQPAA